MKRKVFWITVGICFLLEIGWRLWLAGFLVDKAGECQQLRTEIAKLKMQAQDLEGELAHLASLRRIKKEAQQLGLTPVEVRRVEPQWLAKE